MAYKIEVYRDRKKEFRWRLVAPNGKIIAYSAESYHRQPTMLKSLVKVQAKIAVAKIVAFTPKVTV